MNGLCILWAQYGPYHFARVTALQRLLGADRVHAVEMASKTTDYAWNRTTTGFALHTMCNGLAAEELPFRTVFIRTRCKLEELRINVCFLPSYSPKQSLAALLAAKSLGIRTVMMNESHAGTARATGFSAWIKRRLIGLFDAALVGGTPQKRYFASMGLSKNRILTGYDAIDNDYFAGRAEEVRGHSSEIRCQYGLPEHYFLSLGRFVPKKNLRVLIQAYRQYLDTSRQRQNHLVMVGSGEEEAALRSLCAELRLPIYDHSAVSIPYSAACSEAPGVHFYGFRQIDENPIFFALADAFILPSLWEEWGLVVNEAMASGLPIAVSETAGCVEDLLESGCCTGDMRQEDRLLVQQLGLALKIRQNGFVFSPHSAEELSRMLLVFEGSLSLRTSMGMKSRQIVERFSCDNFARNALLAAQVALQGRSLGSVAPISRPFHADASGHP